MSLSTWQVIRDRKVTERTSRIPPEWLISSERLPNVSVTNVLDIPTTCGVLSPNDLHITSSYNARSLASAIRKRKLTAAEVATAFCKRAAVTHQLTNCITEPLFQSALARAAYLDEYLERTGEILGPLHGLPVSVKDTFNIKGVDSSIGIAALAFKPATSNALLVDLLLKAGAVIHCKTNIPQTLSALDSINNVFGRTLNPLDRNSLTAGGSSGGEGVLVAMRGSIMGVGTDVGGSIRIPAMCNGVVGFKPSVGRVPYAGQQSGQLPQAGKVGLEASAGPIARELNDIGFFMEVIEMGKAWEVDPAIVPGGWWSDISPSHASEKLRIGVLWKDGIVKPLPPIKKVMLEVIEKLKSHGVEIVDVDAPRWKECQGLANKFFGVEGGNHMFDLLESTGEPLIPWLQGRMKRKHPRSVDDLRDLMAHRVQLQTDFLKIWKDKSGRGIDAIICPVAPHPVPPIDRWNSVGYTSSFVLLDYPAGTLPVRGVRRDDLEEEIVGESIGAWDKANRELCGFLRLRSSPECHINLKTGNKETINRDGYIGSPLSIQIITPRLQERRLYDAMVTINKVIHMKDIGAKL